MTAPDLFGNETPATEKPKRAPKMYEIPAGTAAGKCRSCGKKVFWTTDAENPEHRRILSVDHVDAYPPTAATEGRGFSHFADCPDAGTWRKR